MEIDLKKYRAGYGNYRYKHVVMIRPPDVPPMVPPKDGRRATVAPLHVVNGERHGGLESNGSDEIEADRSKSMGDMPESEGVGGWNFGLLDSRNSGLLNGSHFAGETESNYMDWRDSEYSDSNRSSLI